MHNPARDILEACLRGEPWPEARLNDLLESDDAAALFGVLAEGLSDRFEPRLVDAYADIFANVIAAFRSEWRAEWLRERYARVRRPRRFDGPDPETVVVLSRITLGADIAVTSVILDALKRRFPSAAILFVAPRKSYELFAADDRIGHLAALYGGSIEDRLRAAPYFGDPSVLVVDPDSRLSQLGLLPVCPEERYCFFESRAYGGDGPDSLTALARRWVAGTFGIAGAQPYFASLDGPAAIDAISVSLGVGENPAKRIPDPFEPEILARLAATGLPVLVDSGGTPQEAERVQSAAAASGAKVQLLRGSFAAFAATIARSRLYVGYDSAGQHAAAASRTPLVSVFAGAPSERFFERWRPTGNGPIEVVRGSENALEQTAAAIDRLLA